MDQGKKNDWQNRKNKSKGCYSRKKERFGMECVKQMSRRGQDGNRRERR